METKEFKGTKGEWYMSNDTGVVIYSDNLRFCQYITGRTEEEALANAQLIAAAPELLNTLMELHDLLEENLPEWYLKGHHNRAEKAINKALGL